MNSLINAHWEEFPDVDAERITAMVSEVGVARTLRSDKGRLCVFSEYRRLRLDALTAVNMHNYNLGTKVSYHA